jgi:hypothetical protein
MCMCCRAPTAKQLHEILIVCILLDVLPARHNRMIKSFGAACRSIATMGRLLGALALVGLCLVATASFASAQNITAFEVTSVGGCNNGQPGILPPAVPDCNLRKALGSNSSVTYSFTIANSSVGNMSVVAVARVLNGLVNMVLYMPGSSPSGLPDDTSKTLYQNLASSEKFLYMPAKKLLPGRYFIKINSYSGNPTLTLSVSSCSWAKYKQRITCSLSRAARVHRCAHFASTIAGVSLHTACSPAANLMQRHAARASASHVVAVAPDCTRSSVLRQAIVQPYV